MHFLKQVLIYLCSNCYARVLSESFPLSLRVFPSERYTRLSFRFGCTDGNAKSRLLPDYTNCRLISPKLPRLVQGAFHDELTRTTAKRRTRSVSLPPLRRVPREPRGTFRYNPPALCRNFSEGPTGCRLVSATCYSYRPGRAERIGREFIKKTSPSLRNEKPFSECSCCWDYFATWHMAARRLRETLHGVLKHHKSWKDTSRSPRSIREVKSPSSAAEIARFSSAIRGSLPFFSFDLSFRLVNSILSASPSTLKEFPCRRSRIAASDGGGTMSTGTDDFRKVSDCAGGGVSSRGNGPSFKCAGSGKLHNRTSAFSPRDCIARGGAVTGSAAVPFPPGLAAVRYLVFSCRDRRSA